MILFSTVAVVGSQTLCCSDVDKGKKILAKKNALVENQPKALFHLSLKPTRKLAARAYIQSQYLKELAASLRVGFCDEWKRGFNDELLKILHLAMCTPVLK